MTQKELDIVLKKHKAWLSDEPDGERANLQMADLHGADMRGTDLRGADLHEANLHETDLRGANLDFSCWPLWCGSLDAVVDRRIAAQIAYHFCSLVCDDPGYIKARNAILDFANEFHRVGECGELEPIEGKEGS